MNVWYRNKVRAREIEGEESGEAGTEWSYRIESGLMNILVASLQLEVV